MDERQNQIVIVIDRFHLWLVGIIGGVLVFVFSGFQLLDIWDIQRRSQDRQRLSTLEGQVKAISEAIQHE